MTFTNFPNSFQNFCAIETGTGLSDAIEMTVTVMKINKFEKLKPRIVHYRGNKNYPLKHLESNLLPKL